MKDIPCSVVEDLLPLYIDGICSNESKEMIEAHIKDCQKCQMKINQMNYGIPEKDIEENLNESKMLGKLSDIWKKKTGLNIRAGLFGIIFYIAGIIVLFIAQDIGRNAYYRFETGYLIAAVSIAVIIWLFLGALIAFLGSRPKGSVKTFIFEVIIIGIPSLFMMTSIITVPYLPGFLRNFIFKDVISVTAMGALLLGCEIYRFIRVYGRKNKVN